MQTALRNIEDLLSNFRQIIQYYKKSNNAMRKLTEYENINQQPVLKLKQEVKTRWNSTYFTIKRFCELENALRSTMDLLDHKFLNINKDDWQICSELCEILEPFEMGTREISQEKYLSGSLVIPLRRGLISMCNKMLQIKDYNNITVTIVKSIRDQIYQRFSNYEYSKSLCFATILDPRFKNVGFSEPNAAEAIKKDLYDLVTKKIFKLKVDKNTSKMEIMVEDNPSTSKFCVWEEFDTTVSKDVQPPAHQCHRYIESSLINRNKRSIKLVDGKQNILFIPINYS